jgi:sec-independent protein translocase protein TatA
MFNLGPLEIALIVGAAVLFFGANKLTSLASDAGKAIKTFKNELKDVETVTPEVSNK